MMPRPLRRLAADPRCRAALDAARRRARGALAALALGLLAAAPAGPATAAPAALLAADEVAAAAPTPAIAAQLMGLAAEPSLTRVETPAPAWRVESGGAFVGLIGSTWEIAGSTGYSGRPLDVLVAVTPEGRVAGARLMRHAEPVLTLGISDADISAYVDGFRGYDTAAPPEAAAAGLPDVISRATVSTGVIRDGILRTARVLAGAQGQGAGGVDRVAYAPAEWAGLESMGALAHASVSMADAARAFAGARRPLTASDAPFLEFWTGILDTPAVGRNLLGQQDFTTAAGSLAPGQAMLGLFSRGLHSPRGTEWRRSGRFDGIEIRQGDVVITPSAEDLIEAGPLEIAGAPALKERSVFRVNADPAAGGLDLAQPFTVTVTATRPAEAGRDLSLRVSAETTLPAAFRIVPPPPEMPLWQRAWLSKQPQIAVVGAMLGVLGLILFGQEWLVRRPRLWRRIRLGYLATTLVVLGWGLGAQLSVVQVVAFLHALLSGFRWETFLVAPLIFVLWSAVALGMLFWGRGVFCGWLCPFGALQELTNQLAQRLGLRQIAVPQALHERLWVIKYTLFVAIVALSFYSMEQALILSETEPFKTAISMRFMRPWPFVLYVLVILAAGLYIERFYCRYLCPLGAGLAIPAKLKIFDWLKRRPQCGRECRLCETKCTVGAIDALGRINANECVLCLRCQVIMDDPNTCPVLKRRARGGGPTGGQHPASAHAAAAQPLAAVHVTTPPPQADGPASPLIPPQVTP